MKVALVTGGNRGLGKAICAGLFREGFTVLLGARDLERGRAAAAELGSGREDGEVRAIQLDVVSAESISAAASLVQRDFGALDVLVNNAGIGAPYARPMEQGAETLRRVYETNVFAVVAVTNAFLPLLRAAPAGRIVNVTSKRGSLGEEGAWVGQPSMAYSSSKTALNALTAHYARALRDTPIKVNGAAPGHVATDFNGFRGTRTPEQGAAIVLRLGMLGADGPTGGIFDDAGPLAW